MTIPLLITAWNRPDKINKLITSLKYIKPKNIYISVDGANNKSDIEFEKVYLTRKIINENINWKCNLEKKFNNKNLGCRLNMIRSINWIFEKNETAIILEDDCIPHPDFFKFCFLLLEKYKEDKDIWSINGTNMQDGKTRGNSSYYFSKYFHSWGWATWKDRWLKLDEGLETYESFKSLINKKYYFLNKSEQKYWVKTWDKLKYKNEPDSWAYRWLYTCIANNGLCITPNKNLINNIGFDNEATNTKILINNSNIDKSKDLFLKKGVLVHPKNKIIHYEADEYTFTKSFKISILKKLSLFLFYPKYYIKKLFYLLKTSF
tara:strand:- start:3054 stop:4010 length:957 start_codon:yes stop_codon:yes gene_type:complete